MVRHFFLDKINTIIEDSYTNMGLNPVMELNYGGKYISRGLIHFDTSEIKSLIEDKTFADLSKLSFKLKMTNCFSVDGYPNAKLLLSGKQIRQRAASFDIIAFKLPFYFDEGRGFEFNADFWINNNRSFDNHASNWFFSYDGKVWPVDEDKVDLSNPNLNMANDNIWILEDGIRKRIYLDGGIYSDDFLNEQYTKFRDGEDSIVIDMQHFDFGNENLSMDITKYVMDVVNGECNYGIGLMFVPRLEKTETKIPQYVGFFTNNTNTYFHPYVECLYSETIQDDRENFCIGKTNRLYLYSTVNGEPTNLDNIPTCSIDGKEFEVKQAEKGTYFVQISPNDLELEEGTIGYDLWQNLASNGVNLEDVEMEFEVHSLNSFHRIGNGGSYKRNFVPSIYGINDSENIFRGDVREVTVDFRKEYDSERSELIDSAEYRLYVMDGTREINVIDYQPIEKGFLNNFFMVYTQDLVPNNYFVDIRVRNGREEKYFKKALRFTIVSDVTERYE